MLEELVLRWNLNELILLYIDLVHQLAVNVYVATGFSSLLIFDLLTLKLVDYQLHQTLESNEELFLVVLDHRKGILVLKLKALGPVRIFKAKLMNHVWLREHFFLLKP